MSVHDMFRYVQVMTSLASTLHCKQKITKIVILIYDNNNTTYTDQIMEEASKARRDLDSGFKNYIQEPKIRFYMN